MRRLAVWIAGFACVVAAIALFGKHATPPPGTGQARGTPQRTSGAPSADAAANERTALAGRFATRELRVLVVDAAGVPQPGLTIRFASDDERWKRWRAAGRRETATTDENGADAIRLPPVAFTVSVDERPLRDGPVSCDLGAAETPGELRIVVLSASEWPPIAGDVVDENGAPVEGAEIEDGLRLVLHGWTDAQGHFEIARPLEAKARTVALFAHRDGYDDSPKDAWVAWGQRNVRLVLRRSAPLRVRLLDAAGAVVEAASLSWRWDDYGREPLHFEGGVYVGSATRGHSVLKIELAKGFDVRRGVVPAPIEFDVADATPIERSVRLSPAGARLVRVQRSDGVPCAGSQLEVVSAAGDPVTVLADVEVDAVFAEHAALRLFGTGTTDARGEARVSGPTDQPLALRVFGRHEPAVVAPFDVAARSPLDVRVTAGASAAVRLIPTGVVDYLREQLGEHGVRLHRLHDGIDEWWPTERQAALPLTPTGDLAIDGAPPGAWELCVGIGELGPPLLTLTAGDNGDVVHDLSAWTPGEIVGHARRNGVLQRQANIWLAGECDLRPDGEPRSCGANARTDAEGAFRARVLPGRYSLVVLATMGLPGPGPGRAETFAVEVAAGQVVAHDFDELVGVLELTLVDEDGKPVHSVYPSAVRAATDLIWVPMGASDGDGVSSELSAGHWLVMVEPRSQRDAAFVGPRHQLLQRLRALRKPIGEVTIRGGATTRATLQVPASLR